MLTGDGTLAERAAAMGASLDEYFSYRGLALSCGIREALDRMESWRMGARLTGGRQPHLLRDIFNPFRPIPFDPAWRTPSVLAVAKAIYEEQSFENRMLKSYISDDHTQA